MKTLDMHTHAFPDGLAARAIGELERRNPVRSVGAGTVAALLESMDRGGVDVAVVCAIATKPEQAESILAWCDAIRSERIVPFPSLHPDTPNAARRVERIVAEGFGGIKLHAMYQDFVIDDTRMDEIYAAAEACGLVIQFHCGQDFGWPAEDDRAAPARTARVIERFPRLKAICAHMGGWRMWDASEADLVGKGVYFETSFSLNELSPERAAEMIRRHGADRVFFGTDWPWARHDEAVGLLERLPITRAERDGIRWANAARLLGL